MAHVLVVDDDRQVRAVVRRHLEGEGHEVTEAEDGAEALALVTEGRFDVVVTDLFMPGVDGMEFAIRLGQRAPSAKLVAMSGGGYYNKREVLEMARRLGAVRTLEKPFGREELLAAVAAALRTH